MKKETPEELLKEIWRLHTSFDRFSFRHLGLLRWIEFKIMLWSGRIKNFKAEKVHGDEFKMREK